MLKIEKKKMINHVTQLDKERKIAVIHFHNNIVNILYIHMNREEAGQNNHLNPSLLGLVDVPSVLTLERSTCWFLSLFIPFEDLTLYWKIDGINCGGLIVLSHSSRVWSMAGLDPASLTYNLAHWMEGWRAGGEGGWNSRKLCSRAGSASIVKSEEIHLLAQFAMFR